MNNEECDCRCHTEDNVIHMFPCCFVCSKCQENIKPTYYQEHVERCKPPFNVDENNPYFKYETLKLDLMEETLNVQTDDSEEARSKYNAAEKALDEFVYKYLGKEDLNDQ